MRRLHTVGFWYPSKEHLANEPQDLGVRVKESQEERWREIKEEGRTMFHEMLQSPDLPLVDLSTDDLVNQAQNIIGAGVKRQPFVSMCHLLICPLRLPPQRTIFKPQLSPSERS